MRSKLNGSRAVIGAHLIVMPHTITEQAVLPAGETSPCFGPVMYDMLVDDWSAVQLRGLAICTAATSAISIGQRLTADAAGEVKPWAPGAGVEWNMVGIANTVPYDDHGWLEVELSHPGCMQAGGSGI